MAKVVLIGMYDAWVLGLRNLANALVEKDHSVTIVHFKMMANKTEPFYLRNTTCSIRPLIRYHPTTGS